MALTVKEKVKVIEKFRKSDTDTGSASVQVGIFSKSIDELVKHLKQHPKDNHSRRGLLKMVNKRKKLLTWLSLHNKRAYNKVVKEI